MFYEKNGKRQLYEEKEFVEAMRIYGDLCLAKSYAGLWGGSDDEKDHIYLQFLNVLGPNRIKKEIGRFREIIPLGIMEKLFSDISKKGDAFSELEVLCEKAIVRNSEREARS